MYYILLKQSGTGLSTIYKYMTTIEGGSGESVKKRFETLAEAQAFVQEMIASGDYALNDFQVVRGVVVTADITLTEETSEGGNG